VSYFNNGIAFHGYADVPAYPASHGCVRLPMAEAPFAYAFMSIGTPVAVH
jgi:lipoprotein-anchoring transpeptidase ErfK/SrfK